LELLADPESESELVLFNGIFATKTLCVLLIEVVSFKLELELYNEVLFEESGEDLDSEPNSVLLYILIFLVFSNSSRTKSNLNLEARISSM